jgi:gliding motility-associated-like protein
LERIDMSLFRTIFWGLVFLAFCVGPSQLEAAHLIGGEITYVCNGNNSYTFTMKIYRDCAGGGAEFDGAGSAPFPATVTIYNGNTIFDILSLGGPVITDVEANLSNPCLIVPPSVCVEEGIYTFTLNLPPSSQSYHIVYQRCCRNNTISNLIDPGSVGATYYVELTPLAQQTCNSSPTFNNQPPIVICSGEPIDFDFSATDPDGDDLEYVFCAPFTGGGTNTTNPEIPTGVAPDPDLPPPFLEVPFLFPTYSGANPMGGNPQVTINPNTGLITGVPQFTGQYVVGVCVIERNSSGQILSILRRDFQFNVANCEPTVVADIQEDEIINGDDFLIVSCGENTVDFINESFQVAFINEVVWEFNIGGNTETYTTFDATVTFPGEGSYQGRLLLNPGTTCGDTADIFVDIYPEIVADFEYAYDTCDYGPVNFTDLSFSGAGPNTITDWNWSFADGNSSTQTDPTHLYEVPGNFPVSLTVEDINGCVDVSIQNLPFFPVPDLLVIAPDEVVACEPATIFFNNLSVPIDSTYDIVWDFGDGTTGTGVSPTHEYQNEGIYTVSIAVTSPIGCFTDTVFFDLIEVLPSPTAGFSFTPGQLSNLEPTLFITDESLEAQSWNYDLGATGKSFDPNPVFTFPDTGLQVIRQIVTHESGCTDTLERIVDVVPIVTYFLPNAFSPNGDGVNDGYRGEGIMEGARDFRFQVWNRYGEVIFETNDPYEPWNGRKGNVGALAPEGVYIVYVNYVTPRGQPVKLTGYATLIR